MIKFLRYYFGSTFRRKELDKLLRENIGIFKSESVVLDIGGRDRGLFLKPKKVAKKWIFADVNKDYHPDIILDVENMDNIADQSVDIILAMELFEHVANPEKGIQECFRVLKNGGTIVMSAPFLYRIHADPFDFQRWTETKWKKVLFQDGFSTKKFIIMGRFFSVMSDNCKMFAQSMPRPLKMFFYILFIPIDILSALDRHAIVKSNKILGSFHGGYFIIAEK